MGILSESEWQSRAAAHDARVRPWIAPRLARSSRQEKHPVEDFLFEYYSYRPSQLLSWHPGMGVILKGDAAQAYQNSTSYHQVAEGVTVDPEVMPERRREGVGWMLGMLGKTRERTPFFGCSGLHEWAMVYRADSIRHPSWPLRFSPDEIARIVESMPICCSHHDAFRFFTSEARPLNKLQPSRPLISEFEQRGCLHANMDLYKWASKLSPFAPSELVADTFELARDIRTLDMRASPYDFSGLGYTPVMIETAEGRAEYEREQREFARRSEPLRDSLISLCAQLVESWKDAGVCA